MDLDPGPAPQVRRGTARRVLRRVLALPVHVEGTTVGGMLAIFIVIAVALIVCLPIVR